MREADELRARKASAVDAPFKLDISLPEACARAEQISAESVPSIVVAAVCDTEPEEAATAGDSRFRYRGETYECRAAASADDAGRLDVVIGRVYERWDLDRFSETELRLTGEGRFTRLALRHDRTLRGVRDAIGEELLLQLEEDSRRIAARTLGKLLTLEHEVATALYIEVRAALDADQASRVGLYALLDDGRAMYFLDPAAIMAVLNYCQEARPSVGPSPLTLTALLVRAWVLSDDTAAKFALANGTSVQLQLANLRYTTTPGFDVAETALYGSAAVVQPLVSEGRVRLIAGYPLSLRSAVGPKLSRLRPRFTDIIRSHEKATRALIRARFPGADQRWNADRLAELLGYFVGGYTDSLQ